MLRGKILTAIPLLVLFFSLKSGQSDAVSYDNAERSLLVYRSGMQSVMDHIRKNRIIFPETETADKEILSENVRSELKSVWMSFVEYFIAAEAVEKKFCGLSYVDRESDIRCFNITKAAF